MTVVGEAFVEILPDTSKFRSALQTQLQAATKAALKVPVQLDGKGLTTQLRTALKGVTVPALRVPLQVDSRGVVAQVRSTLRGINAPSLTVPIKATTSGLAGQLKAQLASARGSSTLNVPITSDASKLNAQLRSQLKAASSTASLQVPVQVQGSTIRSSLTRSISSAQGPVAAAAAQAGRGASRAFEQELGKSNEAVRKLLAEFRNLLVVTAAVGLIARPFEQLVGAGVKAAASLQQTRVAFSGLLGSAEEADSAIKQFQQFAAVTPFEFPGLVQAAQRFIGLGKTVEETLGILETIGNATAAIGADQEAIGRVTLAFSQIQAAGRLLAQDLNQVTQALPNITRGAVFEQLAKDMGKSTDEIRQLQEEGAIPAEQAISSLLKVMQQIPGAEGAMERQSKTLIGVFSTLKDEVRIALATSFDPLVPALTESIKDATPIIEQNLQDVGNVFADAATEFLPALLDAFTELAPVLIEVTSAFLALAPAFSVVTTLAVALEPAISAFADIVNAIPAPLIAFIGTMAALKLAMSGLDKVAGGAFRTLTEGISGIAKSRGVSNLTATLGVTKASFQGLGAAIGSIITPANIAFVGVAILTKAFVDAKQAAAEHKRTLDALTTAYLDNAKSVQEDIQAMVDATITTQGLDDVFRDLNLTTREFQSLIQQGDDGFSRFLTQLVSSGEISEQTATALKNVSGGVQNISGVIGALLDSGADLDSQQLKLIKTFLGSAKAAQDSAKAAIDKAVADGLVKDAAADAAEALQRQTDGSINYVAAMNQLGLGSKKAGAATGEFTRKIEEVGSAAEQAAAKFKAVDDAIKEVTDAFDHSIGAVLDLADAEDRLSELHDRLGKLNEDLSEELHGSVAELRAVESATSSLHDAEDGLADAHERLAEATEDASEAQENLNELRATEGVRAAKLVAEAENDLAQTKQQLIELEQQLADKIKERQKAEDPVRAGELERLRRLRLTVGAAPPSFLEDLDQRIEKLAKEVGPDAVARLNTEIGGLQLDIQDQNTEIGEAVDGLTDAQRQAKEGTDELREAEEQAKDAADDLRDAHKGVDDATRQLADRNDDLKEAYRKLEPDQIKVRDLQREIEKAHRDTIKAAFDLAVAIAETSGQSAENIKRTIGQALDNVIDQFPEVQGAIESLPGVDIELGASFKITNIDELITQFNQIFNEASGDIIPLKANKFAAVGAAAFPGDAITVGELGPELFVPERAGRILSTRESIDSVARGIREALVEALGELPIGAQATGTQVSVVAPSTDARDIVDGVVRGLRAAQYLNGVS